jgi:splicing factor U2AF subunit
MELGGKKLIVQRASVGAKSGFILPPEAYATAEATAEIPQPTLSTRETQAKPSIVIILNMVAPEELGDEREYQDIYEDIKRECESYGKVLDLHIPRPTKKDRKWGDSGSIREAQMVDEENGVGRVYVKFADLQAAQVALKALDGRSSLGRSIVARLLTDGSQVAPPLNLIFAPQ